METLATGTGEQPQVNLSSCALNVIQPQLYTPYN